MLQNWLGDNIHTAEAQVERIRRSQCKERDCENSGGREGATERSRGRVAAGACGSSKLLSTPNSFSASYRGFRRHQSRWKHRSSRWRSQLLWWASRMSKAACAILTSGRIQAWNRYDLPCSNDRGLFSSHSRRWIHADATNPALAAIHSQTRIHRWREGLAWYEGR